MLNTHNIGNSQHKISTKRQQWKLHVGYMQLGCRFSSRTACLLLILQPWENALVYALLDCEGIAGPIDHMQLLHSAQHARPKPSLGKAASYNCGTTSTRREQEHA